MENTFIVPDETSTLGIINNEKALNQETTRNKEVTLENEALMKITIWKKKKKNISRETRSEHAKMSEMENPDDSN
ncbi:hypothetical protein ILUMI_16093 [Ignelater luminosus]|uniref:Uncharacterized protein n=1 Tax=Ignelater luminosus TaxID=2038154 RepID=A0A8K0CV41_IGNLU|nr:hypothetical protein ILUMI_16093 [Ignelater luminosus]